MVSIFGGHIYLYYNCKGKYTISKPCKDRYVRNPNKKTASYIESDQVLDLDLSV